MHSQIAADTPTLTHKQTDRHAGWEHLSKHKQIVNLPLTRTVCAPRPHNPCVSQTHWKTHDAACIFCSSHYSYITTCLLVYILRVGGFCYCVHIYLAAWTQILKLSPHVNDLYINYVLQNMYSTEVTSNFETHHLNALFMLTLCSISQWYELLQSRHMSQPQPPLS